MQCVGHSLLGSSQEQTDHKRNADLLKKSVLHPRSAVSRLGTSCTGYRWDRDDEQQMIMPKPPGEVEVQVE